MSSGYGTLVILTSVARCRPAAAASLPGLDRSHDRAAAMKVPAGFSARLPAGMA